MSVSAFYLLCISAWWPIAGGIFHLFQADYHWHGLSWSYVDRADSIFQLKHFQCWTALLFEQRNSVDILKGINYVMYNWCQQIAFEQKHETYPVSSVFHHFFIQNMSDAFHQFFIQNMSDANLNFYIKI